METMVAFWDGPDGVFGLVLGQADWASAITGLGQAHTLTQHCFRVRFDGRPIEAHHNHGGQGPNRDCKVGIRAVASPCISPDPAADAT